MTFQINMRIHPRQLVSGRADIVVISKKDFSFLPVTAHFCDVHSHLTVCVGAGENVYIFLNGGCNMIPPEMIFKRFSLADEFNSIYVENNCLIVPDIPLDRMLSGKVEVSETSIILMEQGKNGACAITRLLKRDVRPFSMVFNMAFKKPILSMQMNPRQHIEYIEFNAEKSKDLRKQPAVSRNGLKKGKALSEQLNSSGKHKHGTVTEQPEGQREADTKKERSHGRSANLKHSELSYSGVKPRETASQHLEVMAVVKNDARAWLKLAERCFKQGHYKDGEICVINAMWSDGSMSGKIASNSMYMTFIKEHCPFLLNVLNGNATNIIQSGMNVKGMWLSVLNQALPSGDFLYALEQKEVMAHIMDTYGLKNRVDIPGFMEHLSSEVLHEMVEEGHHVYQSEKGAVLQSLNNLTRRLKKTGKEVADCPDIDIRAELTPDLLKKVDLSEYSRVVKQYFGDFQGRYLDSSNLDSYLFQLDYVLSDYTEIFEKRGYTYTGIKLLIGEFLYVIPTVLKVADHSQMLWIEKLISRADDLTEDIKDDYYKYIFKLILFRLRLEKGQTMNAIRTFLDGKLSEIFVLRDPVDIRDILTESLKLMEVLPLIDKLAIAAEMIHYLEKLSESLDYTELFFQMSKQLGQFIESLNIDGNSTINGYKRHEFWSIRRRMATDLIRIKKRDIIQQFLGVNE